VAYIANMAAALVSLRWDGFGLSEVSWTLLVIIVVMIITLSMIFTRRDVGYSAVIMWALGGIIVKQIDILDIVETAAAGIVIIVVALIIAFSWLRKSRKKNEKVTEIRTPI
jgi:hypothetical protein